MKSMLLWPALLAAALCACSPPAPTSTSVTTEVAVTPGPEQEALIAALTPVLATELGQPVTFSVDTARTDGDWGWVVATPKTQSGAPIDFSQTKYADRAEAGVLDGQGLTYALLQRVDGAWSVRDFVVGPSDVAYLEWPARYGAPASLMGLD